MSPIVCLRWLPRIVAATRYRGGRARDKLPRAGILIARKANQAPASGCLCIHDSRRLMGVPKVRGVREGRPDLASYLAANSSRRRFMNGSAFSAKLRQRSACSFKNELSILDPNAAYYLGTACLAVSSVPGLFRLSYPSFLRLQPEALLLRLSCRVRAAKVWPRTVTSPQLGALDRSDEFCSAMGIPTPAGGQWHAVTVKRVLERMG
jgi:hypothetical protein